MGEQKHDGAEETTSKIPRYLSSEQRSIDLNLHDILAAHLASLGYQNPGAHSILTEKIHSGFFAEHQGGKIVNSLAYQILMTLDKPEEENANIDD